MRCLSNFSKLLLAALSISVILSKPSLAEIDCNQAGSTGLTYQCFQKQLQALDDQLNKLLNQVPTMAATAPTQQYRDLWMEHLENNKLDRSNVSQLMAFQKARRDYCLYVNSIAFQGTGYGSIVLQCEIELTKAALKNEV
jgi:uncharacterized protein YecT (DUF1311 family)